MKVQKLTVRQAYELLKKNELQRLGLDIRFAEIHHAPGGGEMITYNSHLTTKALQFIARRKRSLEAPITVVVYETTDDPKLKERREIMPIPAEIQADETLQNQRAQTMSRRVVTTAKRVAKRAENVHAALSSPQLKSGDFNRPEVKQALSIFGVALKRFRKNTENAIREYIENGNTLIMDLITQYDIDIVSLKHALKVACFATELTAMMGENDYFGSITAENLFQQLGEPCPQNLSDTLLKEKKQALFEKELVEIFLGGFMHDAGLWQVGLQDGHEIRGAMVVAHTPQIETVSESLVDMVLFHSDFREMAANEGVLRVFALSNEGDVVAFQRDYFHKTSDIAIPENLKKKNFIYKIFSDIDLRKLLPISIAEVFITQTQARKPVPHHAVVTDLASYNEGGHYQKFIVALCNMQTDVIAPARAMVTLDGHISMHRGDQPRWLNVNGCSAVSVGHDDSRHAPHLITIFSREADGSQKILQYLSPGDQRLWDRTDVDCRMYVPGGRFRSLSYKVVAILRKDIYDKHFKAYEDGVQQRIQAALIF